MTTYAVIQADPNSSTPGEVISTHRTLRAAGRAYQALPYARWAYVAERRPDGSYPLRVEALGLPAHVAALDAANA